MIDETGAGPDGASEVHFFGEGEGQQQQAGGEDQQAAGEGTLPGGEGTPPAGDGQQAAGETPWADTIKDVPLAKLLEARGLDEKIVKLIDHYSNRGDLNEYFKAQTVDYDTMPETDLLRLKIDRDYADYSEEERADLYADAVDRYKLDSDLYSEEQVRRGKTALKADLAALKTTLKQEQESYKFKPSEQQHTGADEQALVEQYSQLVTNSDVYKGLATSGVLKVGEGDSAFNMDVDAKAALAYLTSDEAYQKAHLDANGKPDIAKQMRIAAAATDPLYEQKLIDHGRKLALIGMAKEMGNEGFVEPSSGAAAEMSDAEKLALKLWGKKH